MKKNTFALLAGLSLILPVLASGDPARADLNLAVRQGVAFLASLYDTNQHLLPEYRGSKVYWLYHDNYLAARMLAPEYPDLARPISEKIGSYGVTRSGKIEIIFDEAPTPFPFRQFLLTNVAASGECRVRTEVLLDSLLTGWESYTDLRLFAALALRRSDPTQARGHFAAAEAMWDGKGFVDPAFKALKRYATYKLALFLLAGQKLGVHSAHETAMLTRLLKQQNDEGGFVTDYLPDGSPTGMANVETTALSLVALRELAQAPALARPARPEMRLYVSPHGSDANTGTRGSPFASAERARDEIRRKRQEGKPAEGTVEVVFRGGTYQVAQPFVLEAVDSGMAGAPVVYRAETGERPVFTGGRVLREFTPVTDPEVLSRIPSAVHTRVLQADLVQHGISNVWPLDLGGFASGRGFRTHPAMELFQNGVALQLARSDPTLAYEIEAVAEPEKEKQWGQVYSKTGRFISRQPVPPAWKNEPELWLFGYWFFGWADSYEPVRSIDLIKREITLAPPHPSYGFRARQPFYALNALSELDTPGEWYLDRARKRVYLLPNEGKPGGVFQMSVTPFPLVELKGVSDVRFENLTWELGSADAIRITGGRNCAFAGATIRQFAGNGVEIVGGSGHTVQSCDIHTLGRGGITLHGGNRKTLTPGGHRVINCNIHDLSRIDRTYTPAIWVSGVGHRIARNWFHHIPSSALRIGGNDHLIENNEFNHVVLESDDQGAVDMWGDPTYLGVIYRRNFFHHIGRWRPTDPQTQHGQAAIRLDDAISGVLMDGNIFYRCGAGDHGFGAVQIHGGKDNIVENNVFASCRWGVSLTPWQEKRWLEFIRSPLGSAEINPALYRLRYPEMCRMEQDANANWVRNNLVVGGGKFLFRNSGAVRTAANTETGSAPEWSAVSAGDFFSRRAVKLMRRSGFETLSAEEIGIFKDSFRRQIPTQMLTRCREER